MSAAAGSADLSRQAEEERWRQRLPGSKHGSRPTHPRCSCCSTRGPPPRPSPRSRLGPPLTLPPDAWRLYSLHDGEADGSDGIFGCWRWLPLATVAEEVELVGSAGIVPLFRSGGGDLLYVKAGDGPDRRVFERWHESPGDAKVVAEDLEGWLGEFVARLHAGGYAYRPDELAALIDRNELAEDSHEP